MWIIRLGLMCFVLAFSAVQAGSSGRPCMLPSKQVGLCKRPMDCPTAFLGWPSKSRERSNSCGLEKGKELICCDFRQQRRKPPRRPNTNSVQFKQASNPNFGKKSAQKCKEYSRGLGRLSNGGCSAAILNKKAFQSRKVVKTTYPFIVQLGYVNPKRESFDCSGTLISDQYVVTAAHCLENIELSPPTMVRWLRNDTDVYLTINVTERIPHPDYDPAGQYNDIALLRLEERIKDFDNHIRPACLNSEEDKSTNVLALGWGRTRVRDIILEDLLVAGLPVVSTKECTKQMKKDRPDLYRGVDEKVQFCAGGHSYGKTLCLGDFGGPVVVPTKDCMSKLVGITSSGSRCEHLGIYVKISHFIPWIESIVWPDD